MRLLAKDFFTFIAPIKETDNLNTFKYVDRF